MNAIDIDKARALELAASFVGDDWISLKEDDIALNVQRYIYFGILILIVRNALIFRVPVVVTVVDCTSLKMSRKHRMVIRTGNS